MAEFILALERGGAHEIQTLIDLSGPHSAIRSLQWAAYRGDLEQAVALLKVADARENQSFALECAAKNGDAEMVRALVPASNPLDRHSAALYIAAENGHAQTVALLAPVSDPRAANSLALRTAAERGYADVVDVLIGACKAKTAADRLRGACSSWAQEERDSITALCNAAAGGHDNVVALLVPWTSARLAWKHMVRHGIWQGLDTLSPYVDQEWARKALAKASTEAMQKTRARLQHLDLSSIMAVPEQGSDRLRPRM